MLEGKINNNFKLISTGVGTLAGISTDVNIFYEMIEKHGFYKADTQMQLVAVGSLLISTTLAYYFGYLFNKFYHEKI